MKQITENLFDDQDLKKIAVSFKINENSLFISNDFKNKKSCIYLKTSNGLMFFIEVLDIAKIDENKAFFSEEAFNKFKSKIRETARDISTLFA